MIKILGFNGGQFGDLILGTITARAAKEQLDNPHITYNINKKYVAIKPILENQSDIDSFYISDGYDQNWPSDLDKTHFKDKKFDHIYDAMAKHTMERWYEFKHQTVENCNMHGFKAPSSLQIELNKYFSYQKHKNVVAICPFGATRGDGKNLSIEKATKIVEFLKKLGYTPIQVYMEGHEKIPNCSIFLGSFFDAVKFCLGCNFVVAVDTAMSWIMSGYKHPVLGFYTSSYYDTFSARNWMPINPNAIYLEHNKSVEDINNDLIIEAIKKL